MITLKTELRDFFDAIDDITKSYQVGNVHHSFSRPSFSDRYEVIEKPNWRTKWQKDKYNQEVSNIDQKISHYQSQIEHLLAIQSDLKEERKVLEKKITDLDKKKE